MAKDDIEELNKKFDTVKQILSDSILESIKDKTSEIESAYTKIFGLLFSAA